MIDNWQNLMTLADKVKTLLTLVAAVVIAVQDAISSPAVKAVATSLAVLIAALGVKPLGPATGK